MSKISKLLDAIKDKEIVIPEFQREYVWSLEQAKELLTSRYTLLDLRELIPLLGNINYS